MNPETLCQFSCTAGPVFIVSLGVISGDLQLSDQTVLGEWKIQAKAAVSCVTLVDICL